jgi:hypothetical protein
MHLQHRKTRILSATIPFLLSILFVTATVLLAADECKMWDFKATSAGNLGALTDLAMWNGGTEQQCEAMQKRVEQSLKQRSDAASQVQAYANQGDSWSDGQRAELIRLALLIKSNRYTEVRR